MNLTDHEVSIYTTAAVLLWLAAAAVVAADFFLPIDLEGVGIFMTAVAAVLTIRGYLCRMARREQEAYAYGLEVGQSRSSGRVHSLP